MLEEVGVRERIQRESPECVQLLDFFASRMRPFDGLGWTTFNDWLDRCYRKYTSTRELPPKIRLLPQDKIRQIVFPACL
jgi:hypothetical protein